MTKRRVLWPVIIVTAMFLVLGCATTKDAPKVAKATWQFHDIVDVKFVQQYVKMPKPANVLIIDSRPKRGKFDKGYIPTAVNIPGSKFAKMTDLLPKAKDTLLIFYCQGPT